MKSFEVLVALLAVAQTFARPLPNPSPLFGLGNDESDNTAATTGFSAAQITDTLQRPAEFSRIAYCSSAAVTSWKCGAPCDATPGVEVLQAGGDDGLVPMYFIAHDPENQQIVVAHQGTEASNILSVANDIEFLQVDLNATRFPSTANGGIKVHDGFQQTFERTADGLLSGVLAGLASTGVNKVSVTGHSLGAAIALLDAMMLKQALPANVDLTTTVFGLPRVGNQEFADLVDQTLGSTFTHVTNQNDPVPRVPPRFTDYVHPSNEVHIQSVDDAGIATMVACDGQDNENCSTGISTLKVSVANHLGPYFNGISFGGKACPL